MNLIQSTSHDSLVTHSLREWKPAAPGRRCDMWINGSDIRFTLRTLPEMTYMFHALYVLTPDKGPGRPTSYRTANKLRKRSYMYHVRRLLAESEIKHAGTCRGWCIWGVDYDIMRTYMGRFRDMLLEVCIIFAKCISYKPNIDSTHNDNILNGRQ